jgi:aldehyde oxidoreductase
MKRGALMFELNINEKVYNIEEDISIMEYLREHLGLTAVKNGCDQGACGACSIIADGKVIKACVMKVSRLVGKKIVTLEGLSQREKDVYGYTFANAGAVQCGFCIPGMVMAAKALLDQNNNPTREEVAKAIRGNICRCTGYVKIIDAIMAAAEFFREDKPVPKMDCTKDGVGDSLARVDALAKTLGTGKYVDDIVLEGMAHAKVIRPPAARCKVLSINKEKALAMEGVLAVFTAEDIPGNQYIGHLAQDWPVLVAVGEETRYVGDAIALVVAEKKSQLEEACKAVEIEFDILEPVTDVFEAMKDGAPQIHGKGFMRFGNLYVPKNNILQHEEVKRGENIDEVFAKAAYISEHKYFTPQTEHAFMEPECAIGVPVGEKDLEVITSSQGIFDELHEICNMLGIDSDSGQVRIKSAYVGGGFGGKEDMSVQHHAALAAFLLRRPVKLLLSRKESLLVHPKRHAMHMDMRVACDKDGMLLGMRARIVSDSGAYASLAGPVLQRACTHAAGPYNYQNVDIEGEAVITNNTPGGAFRGFGVTQSAFAVECAINDLASKVGISPWEMRYKNAIRPGQSLPNGQIADEGTAYAETLEACKEYYDEYSKKEGCYVGIASSMKNAGIGVGLFDQGQCHLYVEDSKIHIRSSAAAIGQGLQTLLTQIVCEVTKVPVEQVVVQHPDTKYTPNAGTTTASRQTVFTGEAARRAALKLKEAMEGKSLEALNGQLFEGEYHFDSDPIGADKPNPVSHVGYSYATQVVVLDESGKAVSTCQAIDVGKAINPTTLEGQFEGGTAMCMGYGLTEDFPLKDGIPQAKYGTLGLLRSTDIPEIVCKIIEKNDPEIAFGAKGAGEITAIPFAPAVQNAYFSKDGKFRTNLPLEDTFYKKVKK